MVGSTQNQSPYHQCSDKSHQTHGRHVFCCGQNPPHILTHRGPIGEGGKFAQLWQPFPYVRKYANTLVSISGGRPTTGTVQFGHQEEEEGGVIMGAAAF